jgi:hypothetical protein
MLRSIIFEEIIRDEADWLARKEQIIADLQAITPGQKGGPTTTEKYE